jgi:hypothetical protein
MCTETGKTFIFVPYRNNGAIMDSLISVEGRIYPESGFLVSLNLYFLRVMKRG